MGVQPHEPEGCPLPEREKWQLWWVVLDRTGISFDSFAAMSKEDRLKLIDYVINTEVAKGKLP